MIRWTLPLVPVIGILGYVVVRGSGKPDPLAPAADGSIAGLTSILSRTVSSDMHRFAFEDVTARAGIDFRHFPQARRSLLPEDMGSGVAWGDFDNDGFPDLYLVNFATDAGERPDDERAWCRLFRNRRDGTFEDVSRASGTNLVLGGLGAAWGDFDNDGLLDLHVSAVGPNVLLRNRGDGTFADATARADVADPSFSTGAAWGDYDLDGWIDLSVPNYVRFEYRAADRHRSSRQYGSEIPYTLNPSAYPAAANRLYRNLGDGRFVDTASEAGVENTSGRSLQSVWFDFDLDGHPDLYVANDVSANGVFHNAGDGTFADIGASSLAADYRGAMGLAVGDFDRDEDLDLFITHWIAQENALFENMFSSGWTDAEGHRRVLFMENSESLGLGQISLRAVGWATGLADFDNDGWPDLWIVNGHTFEERDDHARLRAQAPHFYWHRPGAGFYEIGAFAWPETPALVGRGGAHADFDQDGFMDVAILEHGGRAILLRNTGIGGGNRITLRLRQPGLNTHAIGARVHLRCGDRTQVAQVLAGSSYLSQDTSDLHFGLGDAAFADEIVIHWPDGTVERRQQVAGNQVLTVMRAVP